MEGAKKLRNVTGGQGASSHGGFGSTGAKMRLPDKSISRIGRATGHCNRADQELSCTQLQSICVHTYNLCVLCCLPSCFTLACPCVCVAYYLLRGTDYLNRTSLFFAIGQGLLVVPGTSVRTSGLVRSGCSISVISPRVKSHRAGGFWRLDRVQEND